MIVIAGASGVGETTVCRALAVLARRSERGPDQIDTAKHLAVNGELTRGSMPAPHRYDVLDTSALTAVDVTEYARSWIASVVA